MSLMNLQKLRQICYRDEHGSVVIRITLPPNDPLNRVVFKDDQSKRYTVQLDTISNRPGFPEFAVYYNTDKDFTNFDERKMTEFNHRLGSAVHPRVNQIFVENGFHSRFLPHEVVDDAWNNKPFVIFYFSPYKFLEQIRHACYTDGRSMRKAVEFQAYLNKHGRLPPEEIDQE